jgi:hypothetical protein
MIDDLDEVIEMFVSLGQMVPDGLTEIVPGSADGARTVTYFGSVQEPLLKYIV